MVTRDERGRKIEREKERDEKNEGKMMPGKGKEREGSGPQLDKLDKPDKPDKPPLTQKVRSWIVDGEIHRGGRHEMFWGLSRTYFFL